MSDAGDGSSRRHAGVLGEKTIYVRSGARVHVARFSSGLQAWIVAGGCALTVWIAAATGLAVLDRLDRSDQEAALQRLTAVYEARIAALEAALNTAADDRPDDGAATASADAPASGDKAFAAATASLRDRLSAVAAERDALAASAAAAAAERAALAAALAHAQAERDEIADALSRVAAALGDAAAERDDAVAQAARIEQALSAIEEGQEQARDRQQQLLARIEEAAEASIGSLGRMLSRAGVDVDAIIRQLRGESGAAGGPFVPAPEEVRSAAEPERVIAVMSDLEKIALLREAAGRLPFAAPVRNPRFTSGFGRRRDPINGRMALHSGLDMAGPRGTPILAPADGVVTFVGRMSGYGLTVRIRHDFGFETLYAHLNRTRVRVGDRVSRGARIGDMGRTGRATGVHLHYEVRVNGAPVDPMKFIEAARHVL
ncbi:MAG: M23 family metallopeptidase [Rhodobacteraceae bacterium]|nr:MAG: M23 family metallopeptidase [Paracoccaceae bacterium]